MFYCLNASAGMGHSNLTINNCFYVIFQNKHPTLIAQYKTHKDITSATKRKHSAGNPSIPSSTDPEKKAKLQTRLFASSSTRTVSQKEANRLLINYVVEGMCPLRTVEKASFVALVAGLAPSVTVMTRKTLLNIVRSSITQCLPH